MKRTIIYTLLIISFGIISCNKTDDIQEIFEGRNWRLTYIKESGTIFPVSKSYILRFNPLNFDILTPSGTTISGKWFANGSDRTFTCGQIEIDGGGISNDTIAQKMVKILNESQRYEGTTTFLQIISQPNNYIQFGPQ